MSAVVPNLQIVPVSGEVCIAAVPALAARLEALTEAGHHHLLIDLDGCTLLSAAALRVIATTEQRVFAAGGILRLRNPTPLTAQVLAVTGFDRLLDESTETA